MSRVTLLSSALLVAACVAAPRLPAADPFGGAPAWKTPLGDAVSPPLAAAGRRVFVATRDGAVRGLDEATGEVLWKSEQLAGVLSAAEGGLIVRSPAGRLTSLQPRNGAVRWSVETGVAGTLPAQLEGQRVIVAGRGLAALDLGSGRVLWTDQSGAEATTPPVSSPPPRSGLGDMLLTGAADGTLRGHDEASGRPIWSLPVGQALLAPPLVDRERAALYVGTTGKRILRADLEHADVRWRWTVGASVVHPGLLLRNAVLFTSYDAVLYALRPNGNLAWRAPLPSRPLSGPLLVAGSVVVACLERDLVAFDPDSGRRVAQASTMAEIATAPILTDAHLVLGLRDGSVVAFLRSGADEGRSPEPPAVDAPPAGH